ncbi:MAG: hypothetical protein JRF37_05520 [Deltaproteobacteria bacterium]|jgi:hypothetical protein|nr:hypothetical protein [Deltaproteobacteria bacterium]MBW2319127.1 hypothetical protein [Deltaproteobacteria bacterium]OEU44513.1 MAG: hypothetical protein BBJ60_09105 [Desulfobacterales bacterium S7086C20]
MFRKTRGLGAKKGAERRKKDGVKDKKQVWIASGHPKKIEPARDRDQLQRVVIGIAFGLTQDVDIR